MAINDEGEQGCGSGKWEPSPAVTGGENTRASAEKKERKKGQSGKGRAQGKERKKIPRSLIT